MPAIKTDPLLSIVTLTNCAVPLNMIIPESSDQTGTLLLCLFL